MNMLTRRGRGTPFGMMVGGAVSLLAMLGASTAHVAAADAPAAVAAKLTESSDLSALWSGGATRARVIVEFAMPELAAPSSFATPHEADAAQTRAIHAAQDAILGKSLGADLSTVQSSDHALRRMDFSPMFAITASAAEIEGLAANPAVIRIHEDTIADPLLDEAVPLIGMPDAYAAGATGSNFYVAVLDTGARRNHEFLGASKIVSAACYSTTSSSQGSTSYCPGGAQVSLAIDSANDCEPSSTNGCGHGTHVAGIAAGFNTNRGNGEPANGIARNGGLITINVFSRFAASTCGENSWNDCLRSYSSDQAAGLERVYALRNNYQIASVNMSLGGGQYFASCDTNPLTSIIQQLRAANIATVIAAGNDGFDTSISAPGCISSAITVASSTKQDGRSSFSNWGSLIDVVAPGSSIRASYVNGGSTTSYDSLSGTSMAAPVVAGAFAALRTARPNATVSQIEAALKNTGRTISSAGTSKPRIRVDQALAALGGTPPPPPPGLANDNFANRIAIVNSPGTVTGSNSGATKESGEPNHIYSNATTSVWWSFTPTQSGQIDITTQGSSFDTVLAVYRGSAVSGLSQVAANDDGGGALASAVSFQGTAGVQYQIAVAGYDAASGSIRLNITGGGGGGGGLSSIVAAVTPVARATRRDTTVTAFATIINSGNATAIDCTVGRPDLPIDFDFRLRDRNTGQLGQYNEPADIAPGGRQDYLMILEPRTVLSNNIALVFDCANTSPAPVVNGLNTFLLTSVASTAPAPADLVSIAATATNDGIANIPLGGTGFAALAAINIGAGANLQARLQTNAIGAGNNPLPLTLSMCQTDLQGGCISARGATVNFTAGANQTVTFSAFATSNGTPIAFDPAGKRMFVHFFQGNTPVGSASVAVRTTANDASLASAAAN